MQNIARQTQFGYIFKKSQIVRHTAGFISHPDINYTALIRPTGIQSLTVNQSIYFSKSIKQYGLDTNVQYISDT